MFLADAPEVAVATYQAGLPHIRHICLAHAYSGGTCIIMHGRRDSGHHAVPTLVGDGLGPSSMADGPRDHSHVGVDPAHVILLCAAHWIQGGVRRVVGGAVVLAWLVGDLADLGRGVLPMAHVVP